MGNTPETRTSLLIRLHDADDRQAWEEFVGIYTPLIHRFCRNRGLQDTDAADVAQEVMVTVARSISRFEPQPNKPAFRSWLFKITRSKFNNFLEDRRNHPPGRAGTTVHQFIEAQPVPEEEDSWNREYQRWLFEWACRQVRHEFEDSTWEAFWKTAVDNQSGPEVARTLGLSVGAVYVARSRVLSRLKEKAQEISDESDPPNPG